MNSGRGKKNHKNDNWFSALILMGCLVVYFRGYSCLKSGVLLEEIQKSRY